MPFHANGEGALLHSCERGSDGQGVLACLLCKGKAQRFLTRDKHLDASMQKIVVDASARMVERLNERRVRSISHT